MKEAATSCDTTGSPALRREPGAREKPDAFDAEHSSSSLHVGFDREAEGRPHTSEGYWPARAT